MAYASLLSLGQTLEQILLPDNQSLLLHQTEQQLMRSLHEKVGFLLAFLDVISPKSSEKIIGFETRIRDAAYEAEDLIESRIYPKQILLDSHALNYQRLQKVKEELDIISEDLVQMKENEEIEILQPGNCFPAASSKSGSSNNSVIMGLCDETEKVQNLLFGGPDELEIVSIWGMGGIGKTTLARKIYNDSNTAAHFNIRAWVTISQEFRVQRLLNDILISIGDLNHESRQQSKDKLAEKLYKRLKDKRFLIVMDDVWVVSAVKEIKRLLPKDNNGSRILLTTRLIGLATRASHFVEPYALARLHLDECWHLLCHIVFREEGCPQELDVLGKKIAEVCKGLPLVTLLTGGLLYKAERTVDYWEYVLRNMSVDSSEETLEVLNFCYNQLPHHLIACFLYMGVLPEDYAIRRSTLIKLWVGNRFIKPDKSKSLEDVAEEYLNDLVDRNLILVREWTHSGQIKTCYIHDIIRDFCLVKAKEKNISSEDGYLPKVHNNLRHVSILTDKIHIFEPTQDHGLHVHSVIFFSPNNLSDVHFVTIYRLLRVLDALTLSFDEFPVELVELVTLRYIALTFW